MRYVIRAMLVLPLLAASLAWADDYADTIKIFKNAGQSSTFFQNASVMPCFRRSRKPESASDSPEGKAGYTLVTNMLETPR